MKVEGIASKFVSGNVYIIRDPQSNQLYNCHYDNFRVINMKDKTKLECRKENENIEIKRKPTKKQNS